MFDIYRILVFISRLQVAERQCVPMVHFLLENGCIFTFYTITIPGDSVALLTLTDYILCGSIRVFPLLL